MTKSLIFCFLFLLSCSIGNQKQKITLSDDLFVIKNLKNSNPTHSFKYQNNRLYSDSTFMTEFVPLDSTFKSLILVPIMKKELGVDANYSENYILSHFISKQEKIGNLQPITIYCTGDDYQSLILTVLDSTLNPISYYVLSGGQFAGPYEVNDSLTCWGNETYSKINGSEINSYVSRTYVWTDSRNDSAFIDSLVFSSKIKNNGTINTEQIDSLRITRKFK